MVGQNVSYPGLLSTIADSGIIVEIKDVTTVRDTGLKEVVSLTHRQPHTT